MKTIYLGNRNKLFEYRTPAELQKESLKHGITIGNYVTLGNNIAIRDGAKVGNKVKIGNNAKIGYGATIGICSIIRDGVEVGGNVEIGIGSILRKNVTIGNYVTIQERAIIKEGWKITDIVHLYGYVYSVSGYIVDGQIIIQLRGSTRTLAEWESDFWNNDFEFKEGTIVGEEMLIAFNKIKAIMKG